MASEIREYFGWPKSYWLTNGEVDLVVPSEIGPRIMRYGYTGGQNLFHNFPHALGKSGEPQWQNRGGHRLWAAPESALSKALDNGPIDVTAEPLRLLLRQPVETASGLAKEMDIVLASKGSNVTLTHRITNHNRLPVRYAPWALSVMRPLGTAIAALPPRYRHDERLLPTNPLVMWGYTDFSDKRWRFTRRFVMLHQDPAATAPQKTGLFAQDSWAAYTVNGELFVKQSRADPAQEYPDFGCSIEIFTNPAMLEIETLGPMRTVEPGASVEHVEHWSLHRIPDLAQASDDELDEVREGSGRG
jgi:hypothetical protein